MRDPHSRESRGFAFVTMETAEEAEAAITALNATELNGKVMTVEKVCAHILSNISRSEVKFQSSKTLFLKSHP